MQGFSIRWSNRKRSILFLNEDFDDVDDHDNGEERFNMQ